MIVGGGQAGGRVAQALAGEPGRFAVTLVCREPHPPYERPPLSKGVLLGTIGLERCLQWPERRCGLERGRSAPRAVGHRHRPPGPAPPALRWQPAGL